MNSRWSHAEQRSGRYFTGQVLAGMQGHKQWPAGVTVRRERETRRSISAFSRNSEGSYCEPSFRSPHSMHGHITPHSGLGSYRKALKEVQPNAVGGRKIGALPSHATCLFSALSGVHVGSLKFLEFPPSLAAAVG